MRVRSATGSDRDRTHPFNAEGRQIIAPSVFALKTAEQRRVPSRVAQLLESLPATLASAPPPFEWFSEALSERVPVLELSQFDTRAYWHVRWSRPFEDSLAQPCAGCDADPAGPCPSVVPQPLAWMRSTFGTFGLIAEQSGTAPFGRTLAEVAARERTAAAEIRAALAAYPELVSGEPWHDRFAELPAGADDWISLYEADGDWVFADVVNNATVWVGGEWTGEAALRVPVPWARAASFLLARILAGASVRPDDLHALRN